MAPARLQARTRAVEQFNTWLRKSTPSPALDFLSAPPSLWARYIVDVTRTESARKAQLAITHIDAARAAAGADGFQQTLVGQHLRNRVNLDVPDSSRKYFTTSTDTYDVKKLGDYVATELPAPPSTVPVRERLRRLRIRALCLLRMATAYRSKDVVTIRRSSISDVHENMSGQRLVDFVYVPKGRAGAKVIPTPSHVQFHHDVARCPARALLALKALVDELVGTRHDQLFIDERRPHKPLGPERAAKLVKNAMTSAGIDTTRFKADSLRHMSNEKWRHAGIDQIDRNKRGNWSASHVPNKHYSSGIPIDVNFAEVSHMSPQQVREYRYRGLTKRQDDGDAV